MPEEYAEEAENSPAGGVEPIQYQAGDRQRYKRRYRGQAGAAAEIAAAFTFRHQITHQTDPQRRGEIATRVVKRDAAYEDRHGMVGPAQRQNDQG
ncbi:MAG: hypothetical protein PVH86_03845 [Thiogranum sp.]